MGRRATVDLQLFLQLWYADISNQELCKRAGITSSTLSALKQQYDLPSRSYCRAEAEAEGVTPEEIEKLCAEIRCKWSDEEENRRRVGWKRVSWEPHFA